MIVARGFTSQCNSREERKQETEFAVSFEGFDLSEYNNLQLPILW